MPMFKTRFAGLILLSLFLSACSDDDNSGGTVSSGTLTYDGIEGLTYRTPTQAGVTDSKGTFLYQPGESVSFYVGDLLLAANAPGKKHLNLIEFDPAGVARLEAGASVIDNEFPTHLTAENLEIQSTRYKLMTEFLQKLDQDENSDNDSGIRITADIVSQINTLLPSLSAPIDFSSDQLDIDLLNELLAGLCFYPADSVYCQEPPTDAEIAAAPPKPTDTDDDESTGIDDVDPNIDYKEDLEARKKLIEGGKRKVLESDDIGAEKYLTAQAGEITQQIGSRYYLSEFAVRLSQTNTALRPVHIVSPDGDFELTELSVTSLEPSIAAVQGPNARDKSFDYFVTGSVDDETEIVASFKIAGDYRWHRKTLRVLILP